MKIDSSCIILLMYEKTFSHRMKVKSSFKSQAQKTFFHNFIPFFKAIQVKFQVSDSSHHLTSSKVHHIHISGASINHVDRQGGERGWAKWQLHMLLHKGPYTNYVDKILEIFDPPPHCVLLTDQNASCWCISAVSAGSLQGLKTWSKTWLYVILYDKTCF